MNDLLLERLAEMFENSPNHRAFTWGADEEITINGRPGAGTCQACRHHADMYFAATGKTHRIIENGEPREQDAYLCAHCWSELLACEGS